MRDQRPAVVACVRCFVASPSDRDPHAEVRDRDAEAHDGDAEVRDLEADARDHDAEDRDREAEARERARAAGESTGALRGSPASDRAGAASDREHAASDRAASAAERVASSFDDLTGAYRRTAGMIEARREIARMRRTDQPLTFVFVDVDGLKTVNDERGHEAGDTLLRKVAQQIRVRLRNYDLLVRYGGDEFVCLLSNTNARDAGVRFDSVSAALAAGPNPGSVSVGLSQLRKADTAETVLARADAAMYRSREHRGQHGR